LHKDILKTEKKIVFSSSDNWKQPVTKIFLIVRSMWSPILSQQR
jgi:hypothetical protein